MVLTASLSAGVISTAGTVASATMGVDDASASEERLAASSSAKEGSEPSTSALTEGTTASTVTASVDVDDELKESRAEVSVEMRKSMTCSESVDNVVWEMVELALLAVLVCDHAISQKRDGICLRA